MNAQTRTLTVVCHVRAPLLLEPVDSQVESLRACEEEGTIDELLVRSWPKEVRLSENSPYQEVLETYDRFEQWADRRNVSIQPPFRTRTATSQVTDERREVLVTPLLCLECYADDELVAAYPHSTDEETITTEDVIARIRCGEGLVSADPIGIDEGSDVEANGLERDDTGAETAPAPRSDGCPDCGEGLVDGQGLVTCPDCGWTGTIAEDGGYTRTSVERVADRKPVQAVPDR
ncbi:HTH domain-containing protein [Natronococcus amylolyticus]|uniref:HTH domain-containing protein n=1 Tax=Natronococcus amylolyticus TaxID=44470 RepID=UPI000A02F977|nr:HTH domain-containing protein [Natronococcus amylolyticus]